MNARPLQDVVFTEDAPQRHLRAVPDPVQPSPLAQEAQTPRPTLARPTVGATGLFQGWGPRLR